MSFKLIDVVCWLHGASRLTRQNTFATYLRYAKRVTRMQRAAYTPTLGSHHHIEKALSNLQCVVGIECEEPAVSHTGIRYPY